jgi:hypothetical protein
MEGASMLELCLSKTSGLMVVDNGINEINHSQMD